MGAADIREVIVTLYCLYLKYYPPAPVTEEAVNRARKILYAFLGIVFLLLVVTGVLEFTEAGEAGVGPKAPVKAGKG